MSSCLNFNTANIEQGASASSSNNCTRLFDIPNELLREIYLQLPQKIQMNLRYTDRNWHNVSKISQQNLVVKTLNPILSAHFPNLCAVTVIKAETLRDEQLIGLNNLQNLNFLNLAGAHQLTSDGIAHLELCLNLTSLNLSECSRIDDTSLASLGTLGQLETLKLSNCPKITGSGLANLEQLRNLKVLNLFGSGASTDDGLFNIRRFSQLKILILGESATSASDEKITDLGLQHLSQLQQLCGLGLLNCSRIGDRGMKHFRALTNLEVLSIRGCRQLSRVSITYTMWSPNLKILDLSYCRVEEIHIKNLWKYRPNVAVEVTGCEIPSEIRSSDAILPGALSLQENESTVAMCLQVLGNHPENQDREFIEKISKEENAAGDHPQVNAQILRAMCALNVARNNRANTSRTLQTGRFTRFLARCRQLANNCWTQLRRFGIWCLRQMGL